MDTNLNNGHGKATDTTSEFENIVAESRTKFAQPVEPTPLKRKRGRPKGSGRRERPEIIHETNAAPGGHAAAPSVAQPVKDASLLPIISMGIKIPFDVAAENTGFEKFRISDDEAEAPAQQLNQILAIYMPGLSQSDPGTMALMSFSISMGLLVTAKYLSYSAWRRDQRKDIDDVKRNEKRVENLRNAKPQDVEREVNTMAEASGAAPFEMVQV